MASEEVLIIQISFNELPDPLYYKVFFISLVFFGKQPLFTIFNAQGELL